MDEAEHKEILRIARAAIGRELARDSTPVTSQQTFATDFGGAFVTLRRQGRLRGCMGTFKPKPSLADTVESVARSACADPRFVSRPVTEAELSQLKIEVSVLGRLEMVDDPTLLRIGEHGILVQRGEASGCFLPQVATEHGWGVEEFLDKCCSMKAGLSEDAWRRPDTQVYVFSAEVVEEHG